MDDTPFDRIAAQFTAPMFIVTTSDGHESSGCLIGFATQCSIDPRRFIVCLSKENHTTEVSTRAQVVVVHVPRRADIAVAALFGEETGDEIDKFERCGWSPGPDGVPVLDGLDWFAGRVLARADWGDHDALLLDVTDEGAASHTGPLLTSQDVRDFDPGHPA